VNNLTRKTLQEDPRIPVFEGMAIALTPYTARADKARADARKVLKHLGRAQEKAFGIHLDGHEFLYRNKPVSLGDAWDLAYQLNAIPGVLDAEPLFQTWVTDRRDWTGPTLGFATQNRAMLAQGVGSLGCGDTPDKPGTENSRWSLDLMNIDKAWQQATGKEIVIGHPDTGYTLHPEIAANLSASLGYDFVDGDKDPTDPLESGLGKFPSHGTGTASVLVSPTGSQLGNGVPGVFGVAPDARLIPLRTSKSVILFSMANLADAIDYAADMTARVGYPHVISISMGGPFGKFRLRAAIAKAMAQGTIVCAAAGNCVPFVVHPAAYDEVIAVAACNISLGIWEHSSHGSAVDITAPGESVWRAHTESNTPLQCSNSRSSGTSFAVAGVAGIAALWLAKHGRDDLARRFGKENIPAIFQAIVKDTATPQPSWDAGEYGAGLVNALAVLAADPVKYAALPAANVSAPHTSSQWSGLRPFEQILPARPRVRAGFAASPEALPHLMASLLNTRTDLLPVRLSEFGPELLFHATTDPQFYKALRRAHSASALTNMAESQPMDHSLRLVREKLSMDHADAIAITQELLASKDISETLRRELAGTSR